MAFQVAEFARLSGIQKIVLGQSDFRPSLLPAQASLRKKLESSPDSPAYIQTHIGVGYRMLKL